MTGKAMLQGQLCHYEHSGKLPAAHTVTACNAMFASIKHLGILIYTAIQIGMGGEQGQPSAVTAVD